MALLAGHCLVALDLYHRRWHIETFFRELSDDLDFQHWHTRTLHGLWVELLFTMVYVTVVRAHMAEAARAAGLLPGHLSFGRGAEACQRHWCRIPKAPPEKLAVLRTELIDHLPTLAIDVRPGRSFERDTQKRRAESRKRKLQALKAKRHAA
ncbi:MAG: transposase [Planctomycetes bacterium]|nr:transposase [Planctomycetota bacterium]